MKKSVTTWEDAKVVGEHLIREFGDYRECCNLFMPKSTTVIEVVEPLGSCFIADPSWGTQNLVDGCIPPGIYTIEGSMERGHSAHYIDLVPAGNGARITACAGYANHSMIDWRGAKKVA